MLKSYQYTEKSYMDYSMQDSLFQAKEIETARRYVESHHIRKDMKKDCPFCKADTGRYFFTKWNVDYLRCSQCGSIYAVCSEEEAAGYSADRDLAGLRLSGEYQDQITQSRSSVWKEFLEWAQVRSFRFLGRNRGLNIIDVGNRLSGFVSMIKESSICGRYELRESLYKTACEKIRKNDADIILYNDVIKTEFHPDRKLSLMRDYLKEDGILFIGARAGSGFDIITLKENNTKIYPYEHVLLPSVKGIVQLLETNGYEVLEITTPGVMDVKYVMEDIDRLDGREDFVRYLLKERDETVLQEFQRFLQKSCMSSFVRVIAGKAGVKR